MTKPSTWIVLISVHITTLLGAPEIQLPNGLIRGYESATLQNKSYYAFEKIPFAVPPVGNLRFKAPIPPTNWEEPLDTVKMDVKCYQVTSNGRTESEDCLYLSVFTPQLPNNASGTLPVALFIHGGGFVNGAVGYSDLLLNEDIVFVTINYRLGPFGFISTQDEVIPGNNGLKDQHLAITWTHDNIHLFGGDPDKITIIGQSAGSASCAYHLLNQRSEGLFRGAILQSGSSLSPWAFQRRSRDIAFDTAAIINSTFRTNRNSDDLLQFLLSIDATQIDEAAQQYYESELSAQDEEILQGYYWAPVVEVDNPDAFLTEKMYKLLQDSTFVKVPILLGINSEEGLSFNQKQDSVEAHMAAYDEHLSWLVPNDMTINDEDNRTEIGRKIREIYTNGEPLAQHLGDGVRYYSDTSFTRPVIKHAEFHSKFAETYFYQFSYDGKLGRKRVLYDGAEHVGHTQQMSYLFCRGSSCDLSGYPEEDQLASERLTKIWANFVKEQNPTPEPSELLQNVTWPLVSTENGDFWYVDIGDDLEVKNHPKEETYRRWTELYDSLGVSDFDTY